MGIDRPVSAAPLAVFRAGFGLMMALSIVRFWANGWIEKLYLQPSYFFSYRYFEWVKPLGGWTYLLFGVAFVSALMVMLGWRYRLGILAFFLSFTYIELMDKTTYLNHYYFVSLLSFVMIWLPANAAFSLDRRGRAPATVPRWTIACLKVFVGVVYFYAGLAKLNSDWLLHAQPLAIWLPAKYSVPLLGDFLHQRWVHFAFAWGGALYDLLIPFLLLYRPTRSLAFVAVVIFHVLTRVLFPIGMFPYIMIVSALIFFDPRVHEWLIARVSGLWAGVSRQDGKSVGGSVLIGVAMDDERPDRNSNTESKNKLRNLRRSNRAWTQVQGTGKISKVVVGAALLLHLSLPFRYVLHPGELFWTESGYRFSWRVMLMEKAGYLTYRVEDPTTGKSRTVNTGDYLTVFQQKQLATQPDFILEFAHFLAEEFRRGDGARPRIFADSYVALNGRGSQVYVRPDVDLTTITPDTPRTDWLSPFTDDIYGF